MTSSGAQLLPFVLSLSLFDSVSTAQQIILFVLLLATVAPVRNAVSFLVGVSGTYFLCGLLGCLLFLPLQAILHAIPFLPSRMPDSRYYLTELLTGFVLIVLGIRYFARFRHAPFVADPRSRLGRLTSRFHSIGPLGAFGIGSILSLSTLPFSIPYFLALGRIARLETGLGGMAPWVLLYNLGYASPMLAILGIHQFRRHRLHADSVETLQEKARLLNLHLTSWSLEGVGAFSALDAGSFFTLGHALLRNRIL